MHPESFVNSNGKVFLSGKFSVSADNRSFRYGDGCFETMRVGNGKISLEALHFERLFSSMTKLGFQVPKWLTPASLSTQVLELAAKNKHTPARVRLTIYRGDGGLYDQVSPVANYLVQSWPLSPTLAQLNTNGLVLDIYKKAVKSADDFSSVKSNNFLPYVMAALHAKQHKKNDCLLLNAFGKIADSTIANLFAVVNDKIITPSVEDGPIAGVMRRYLLETLPSKGYVVEEVSITPADLAKASEIFLTNAISGIKWVGELGANTYTNATSAALHREFIAPLFAKTF